MYLNLVRICALLVLSLSLSACVAQAPIASDAATAHPDDSLTSRSSSRVYRDRDRGLLEPFWNLFQFHTVPIAGDPSLGRLDAKIAIIEFSDYECPYCRQFHASVLPQLKQTYIDTGIVRFVFKDFPLRVNKKSLSASVAAYCAEEQDEYWPMQARLFSEQGRLGRALYLELARELKLDEARFTKCLNDPDQYRAVRTRRMVGEAIGIESTPTFILGWIKGDEVSIERIAKGVASFEIFAQEIEALRRQPTLALK